MKYISTRGEDSVQDAVVAIRNGIALDGGLYVPESIPRFTKEELVTLPTLDYCQTAALVLGKFLSGYTPDSIADSIHAAYIGTFDHDAVAPLHPLDSRTLVLELWHGPTSAFKDVALQMLPQLITRALCTSEGGQRISILVATSGDTGKAALEGFRDVAETSVTVLFPREGVSDMQRLQMQTQRGKNVSVLSVEGNFDDAQTAAKAIFADQAFASTLRSKGVLLSSANSINWGRLLPQIVYYVYASVRQNDCADFIVPTGNFGNILACWYAKRMGAPIGALVCASNANRVLTDFLETGIYDRRRAFHKTLSPSMDILISSNLERLLFELSGHDGDEICHLITALQTEGRYQIRQSMLDSLRSEFFAFSCDDAQTIMQIRRTYDTYHYMTDPHTAVALHACTQYRSIRPEAYAVVLSTASPYKFPFAVYEAITGRKPEALDLFACLNELATRTGVPVPPAIAELQTLPRLHKDTCRKENIREIAEHAILSLC